jgi:hypothetical protein
MLETSPKIYELSPMLVHDIVNENISNKLDNEIAKIVKGID